VAISSGIFLLMERSGMRSMSDGGVKRETMGPDEYRRLHAVCLDLADQSNVPNIRVRWLTMAQGWIELANEGDGSLQRAWPQFCGSNVTLIKQRRH
jgi:hypothetical protein